MRIRAWFRERCRAWTITAIETVVNDRRPSRIQVLLFLVYLVRGQLARRRQPRGGDPAKAAIEAVETLLSPNGAVPCCNNAAVKAAEVRTALDDCAQVGTPLRAALDELHRRGAFHHEHDVAFAAIVLERKKLSLNEIATALASDYAGIRCDPVYPPS